MLSKAIYQLASLCDAADKTLTLQKTYFQTRDKYVLISAKNAEKFLAEKITETRNFIHELQNSPDYE